MIDRIFQCATEGDLSQDHLLIYRGGATKGCCRFLHLI